MREREGIMVYRQWPAAVLMALALGLTASTSNAYPVMRNGVFVRDADRNLFLVLDGQRHRVPIYPLYPDEVDAIPESGRWVVPGEDGTMSLGEYPHWERHPEVMPGTTHPGLFPTRP